MAIILRERRLGSRAAYWPPSAVARASWARLGPLGRDISLVLLVKVILLFLLWWAFFWDPAEPRSAMDPQHVAQRLLTANPAPETTHADR
jgi:type II secretory pathway component PulM